VKVWTCFKSGPRENHKEGFEHESRIKTHKTEAEINMRTAG
jgi:hypothetical protein